MNVLLLAGLVIASTACTSAKFATAEQDAAAKQFQVPAGKSNIYVYRSEDIVLNTAIAVTIDGEPAGYTKQETYILKSVAPGRHSITAEAENTETLEVVTEAGENYFIWLEVRLGAVTNHAHFHLVDAAQGKPGVGVSKLVE